MSSDADLLQSLFAHSLTHPADWDEWRKTLALFALAEGIEQQTLEAAHAAAREAVDRPDAADEIGEIRETFEQYGAELPLPDDPREQAGGRDE